MLLVKVEILDPSYISQLGHLADHLAIGRSRNIGLFDADHHSASRFDLRHNRCGIYTAFDAHAVEQFAATTQHGIDLVVGAVGINPVDVGQGLGLGHLLAVHADLKGKVWQVVENLRAGGGKIIAPGLLYRAIELHDIVAGSIGRDQCSVRSWIRLCGNQDACL